MAKYLNNIPKIQFPIGAPSKYDVAKLNSKGLVTDVERRLGGAFEHLLNADGDCEDIYKKVVAVANKTTKDLFGYKKRKDIGSMLEAIALLYEKRKKI